MGGGKLKARIERERDEPKSSVCHTVNIVLRKKRNFSEKQKEAIGHDCDMLFGGVVKLPAFCLVLADLSGVPLGP